MYVHTWSAAKHISTHPEAVGTIHHTSAWEPDLPSCRRDSSLLARAPWESGRSRIWSSLPGGELSQKARKQNDSCEQVPSHHLAPLCSSQPHHLSSVPRADSHLPAPRRPFTSAPFRPPSPVTPSPAQEDPQAGAQATD